jgi:hypothetical protein
VSCHLEEKHTTSTPPAQPAFNTAINYSSWCGLKSSMHSHVAHIVAVTTALDLHVNYNSYKDQAAQVLSGPSFCLLLHVSGACWDCQNPAPCRGYPGCCFCHRSLLTLSPCLLQLQGQRHPAALCLLDWDW